MYDLSVTYNLIFFAACVALCVVWLFLAIDVIATKQPKQALKVACLTLGSIGLAVGALFAAVIIGLAVGFVTIEGTSVVIASLKIPALAEFASLFTYYITYAFTALFFLLSLLLVIFSSVKGKTAAREIAAAKDAEPFAVKEETQKVEKQSAARKESKVSESKGEDKDFAIADVRSIMDEISGLVDSLDLSLDDGQAETAQETDEGEVFGASDKTDGEEQGENAQDGKNESAEEYFRALTKDGDSEEELAESDEENQSEIASQNDEEQTEELLKPQDARYESEFAPDEEDSADEREEDVAPQTINEDSRQSAGEEIAAVTAEKTVRTDFKRKSVQREIDDFKEVVQDAPRFNTRTIVRAKDETAREAEPLEGGLPMKKRHVLLNRRNVVNMFSDYLKSKNEDEKARIESSINTIIIK